MLWLVPQLLGDGRLGFRDTRLLIVEYWYAGAKCGRCTIILIFLWDLCQYESVIDDGAFSRTCAQHMPVAHKLRGDHGIRSFMSQQYVDSVSVRVANVLYRDAPVRLGLG